MTVPEQPHRQQPDLPMAQTEHVIGDRAHRRPVIDADLGCAGHVFWLVDHHQWQPPLQHDLQVGIVAGRRVHHEAVHARGEHRRRPFRDTAVRAHRDQQQPLTELFA